MMEIGKNKAFTIACLAGGALSIIAAWQLNFPLFALISSVLFLIALALWKFGYFIIPAFSGALNTALSGAGFELTPSQDAIIKLGDDGYFATMFLSVQLNESSTYKGAEHKALMMDMFERAVSSLHYVVKLSIIVCPLDLSDYLQKLEERRSLLEHKLSQTSSKKKSDEAAILERDIEYLNSRIKKLEVGKKPMQILAYAQTTAYGLTRDEALTQVRMQAKESASILSSSLGASVQPLAGDEMLKCFEWERFSPPSRADLEDQAF